MYPCNLFLLPLYYHHQVSLIAIDSIEDNNGFSFLRAFLPDISTEFTLESNVKCTVIAT